MLCAGLTQPRQAKERPLSVKLQFPFSVNPFHQEGASHVSDPNSGFYHGRDSPRYPQFTAVVRLTSLAPDIIEAILRGDEPDGLSLEKLRKDLPVRWDEQRKCWL